ncbi:MULTISPECIES: hypothetical protein [Clostridium]|uniref:hypothetical protein n=1 Tax=Clostridium TaxID=1485 RepID=UPI000826A4A6|nr:MULTISPECIES: hypothetical protein [Clostridium]PJI10504.1 hypothetical protein CUB90_00485 [Clostridium sp. CT7]
MLDSNCYFPVALMKNSLTVNSSNTYSCNLSCSVILVEPVWLVLNQYVVKKTLSSGTRLIYYIYILNNLNHNIYNIYLKDFLPKGVKLSGTCVINGKYKMCKNKVFYNIHHIKAHSFSKIILSVRPITSGKKINSIQANYRKDRVIINNPCKACGTISSDDILCR